MAPCRCGACNRKFSGVELFDAHRNHHGDHGSCRNPATVVDGEGRRRMWFRDGMWRGPAMSPATRAKIKRGGERRDQST